MGWFFDTLFQILSAVFIAALAFAGLAAISAVGFCLHTGYLRASKGLWGGALLRWIYSAVVGTIVILAALVFGADWVAWLIIIGLMAAGFFGIFIVPGAGD